MKNKGHFQAFDKKWFETHQSKLLWLLNSPFKYLFRRILRIHKDLKWDEKICEIQPNNYKVHLGMYLIKKRLIHKIRADFRTHPKFSKRVYFAFKPLWWTMHFMDWLLFDRYELGFNFGFSTLTVYPDANPETTSVDGQVSRSGVNETFSTIRGGAGNNAFPSEASYYCGYLQASTTLNQFQALFRGFFLFDTSSLTDNAELQSAVLSLYGTAKENSLGGTEEVVISSSTPSSNTDLVAGDFTQIGRTPFASLNYASFSTTAYNDFQINSTGSGISSISKTGISKFSSQLTPDIYNNFTGTWASNAIDSFSCYFADQTGTTNDPKLVITYTTDKLIGEIPVSSNLKGYWRLNGNSTDCSTNGNNGTDTAITYSLANGKFGQGAGFNGTTSYIRNTAPSNLPTGATARTMSAWIYCDTGNTNFKSVCDYGTDATRQRFAMYLNNTNPGAFLVVIYDDDLTSSNSITLNTWTHFAIVYDGSTSLKIYINGKEDSSKTLAGSLNTTLNAQGITIGANNAATAANFFPGKIDELFIENRAWSAQDIRRYYNQAKGRFAAKIN